MEITARQAQLLALLVRASPQPVGREFLIPRLWRSPPTFASQMLSQRVGDCGSAAAAVGLTLRTVRGVGIALAPQEPAA
jgi:hypothetical protein